MPEGPLGLPRFTELGPFVEKTDKEKVVELLEVMHGGNTPVSMDDRGTRTRYTFRLDIPARTQAIPTTQNIPSNLSVLNSSDDYLQWQAAGTLRPPNLDKRKAGSKDEVKRRIKDIVNHEDFGVLIGDGRDRYRPHIYVESKSSLEGYIRVADRLLNEYKEEFE